MIGRRKTGITSAAKETLTRDLSASFFSPASNQFEYIKKSITPLTQHKSVDSESTHLALNLDFAYKALVSLSVQIMH